jgi:hypothetical protein
VRDIEGLRDSIEQYFRDLANPTLQLSADDRRRILAAVDDLQGHLNRERARLAQGYYDH